MTILPDGIRRSRRLTRRQLLWGLAATGGLAGVSWWSQQSGRPSPSQTRRIQQNLAIPWQGPHQAGILTPPPAAAILVALDTTAAGRPELIAMFQALNQTISWLTQGGRPPSRDPRFPPPDSGLLGDWVYPDQLTITVAVGASLFNERYGLAAQRPRHLYPMPAFANDRLKPDWCHGDLLIQLCANHAETNLHALRLLLKQLGSYAVVRWKLEGFIQPDLANHPGTTTVRNLLGFKDGSANLDTHDTRLMDRLVWVLPGGTEPAWTAGGTYQVVRIIRNLVERWDRTPLIEQEQIIGRHRGSGAPLGYNHEDNQPNYGQDPAGHRIPLDAHIRLANPRTPLTEDSRILRRSYNYSLGVDKAGQLEMGLLFISFQSDLDRGFVTIQNRLNGEPLEEYIRPVGGGYYFVLPGVQTQGDYLGRPLLT